MSIRDRATRDVKLLFAARILRMFGYGMLAVVLALFLAESGLSKEQIGLFLTLVLVGDIGISLYLTTTADRHGRRLTLMVGAVLMMFAAIVFVTTNAYWALLIAAIVGVLSPSGNEVGPFLPVEQAALTQELEPKRRTAVFAWYNLAGYFAAALGSLMAGQIANFVQRNGYTHLSSHHVVILGYGVIGLIMLALYSGLTPISEISPDRASRPKVGLHKSRGIVLTMSALFAIDAFAGGFVMQSLIAYWFHLRFGVNESYLGGLLFGTNILAGISSLLAIKLAGRFGLINTMVFTHIPSNVLLILVPLMPTFALAALMLFLRSCLSQMDVPTRQSYVVAVVEPDERSAAGGVTNVARSVGTAFAPGLAGILLAGPVIGATFFVAGGLKIAYDLALWFMFRTVKPPEERA